MDFRHFGRLALLGLLAMAVSSICVNAQATHFGKCAYKWSDYCQGSSAKAANQCPPAHAATPCQISIADSSGKPSVSHDHTDGKVICVTPNTEVDWMEAGTKGFAVFFGATTPFANKKVFGGDADNPDKDSIVADPTKVPECNKYVILHCDRTGCTVADPIVIVQGGQTLMSAHP